MGQRKVGGDGGVFMYKFYESRNYVFMNATLTLKGLVEAKYTDKC